MTHTVNLAPVPISALPGWEGTLPPSTTVPVLADGVTYGVTLEQIISGVVVGGTSSFTVISTPGQGDILADSPADTLTLLPNSLLQLLTNPAGDALSLNVLPDPTKLDRAGGTMTGDLIIDAPNTAIYMLRPVNAWGTAIEGAVGTDPDTDYHARWTAIFGDTAPELGSNSGSNFGLWRNDDAGATLGGPVLVFNRATGRGAVLEDPQEPLGIATKNYVDTHSSPGSMTPAEILTAIKTVDGSGSGLDADTVDGLDSAAFAQFAFKTISVAGQTDVVADLPADVLTFIAGTNITLTTTPGSDAITITAAGGAGYTDEQAQDAVAAAMTNSSRIQWAYNDALGQLSADIFASSVANSFLGFMAQNTIKGRVTAGSGNPEDLTVAQVQSMLGIGNTFSQIAVSGQGTIGADTTSDVLTFVAGTNITITTDPGTDSISIAASGSLSATLADGDYGDIIVSATGTQINVQAGVLDNNDWVAMAADTIKGRANGAGSGVPQDLTAAQVLAIIKTVDGTTSGLDADLLDGIDSTGFAQLAFKTVAVSGQTNVDADTTADTLTFVGASGITITTTPGTDTVTFTGTGTMFTIEDAQDAVGAMLTDSAEIDFTYVDATPSLSGVLINNSIVNARLVNMTADTIKGRANGAGTGAPQDLTKAQVLAIINVADGATANSPYASAPPADSGVGSQGTVANYSRGDHYHPAAANIADGDKGDIVISSGVWAIEAKAVTFAKIQDISTQRVVGRNTAAAGVTEEVSTSQLLDWIGNSQGQILMRGASAWLPLGTGTAGQYLQTNGAGQNPAWATPPSPANVADGDKGDITVTAGSWVIDADAVTYAKMQNVAADDVVLGRISGANGNVEELTGTQVKSLLGLTQNDITNLTTGSTPEFAGVTVGAVPLFPGIPVNGQSAAYTTVLADAQKCIHHLSSDNNPRTFTIDGSVSYPIGTCITISNDMNTVTITMGTNTMVWADNNSTTASRTLAVGGVATLLKTEATRWKISGVGLT